MGLGDRHQCLIYQGSPSRHLPAVAAAAKKKLGENFRCLYLNSPPMVAGMRSYLAATGVDVAQEVSTAGLILTSERPYLVDGRFNITRMLLSLQEALDQSLRDGYSGLWATGDMSWEMGFKSNFYQLQEYEWRLEVFMREHPALCGICQYHSDTLPREALKTAVLSHEKLFISDTLSRINPHFVPAEAFTDSATTSPHLDNFIDDVCQSGDVIR